MSKIITAKELAKFLKLNEITIYKCVNEGKIPGFKVGRQWRFDKDRINELIREGRFNGGNIFPPKGKKVGREEALHHRLKLISKGGEK